ncbi:MAG TPA: hypothetical protein GX521_01855 [Firmicutes bacterium]|nr:hypothetical protein [Bacillota bacterium]
MSRLVCALFIICLCTVSCWARFSVSPVVVEAVNVQAGDSFQILFRQGSEETITVQLSLAQFARDQRGGIVFLEDEASVQRAREILKLMEDNFPLGPNQQKIIEVEVEQGDFSDFSGVLFVKSDQPGIPVRFAVLFLLSSRSMRAGLP